MTDTSRTAKNPKVVPSPKSATTTELDVTEDKKEKPVKEIPMIRDSGFFEHETGDTYEGEFEAKKKDHSVKMHGEVFLKGTNFICRSSCHLFLGRARRWRSASGLRTVVLRSL